MNNSQLSIFQSNLHEFTFDRSRTAVRATFEDFLESYPELHFVADTIERLVCDAPELEVEVREEDDIFSPDGQLWRDMAEVMDLNTNTAVNLIDEVLSTKGSVRKHEDTLQNVRKLILQRRPEENDT